MILASEVKIFVEKFSNQTIDDLNADLMDMGVIDSLGAIEMLLELENQFKVKFSFAEYADPNFFNINSITGAINK